MKHTFWRVKMNVRKPFSEISFFKFDLISTLKKVEGFWYIIFVACTGGFVIITALLSLLFAKKCAFYYNLLVNVEIILVVLAVSGWYGYINYANWLIGMVKSFLSRN